jgi:hypothetical protein
MSLRMSSSSSGIRVRADLPSQSHSPLGRESRVAQTAGIVDGEDRVDANADVATGQGRQGTRREMEGAGRGGLGNTGGESCNSSFQLKDPLEENCREYPFTG